MRHNETMQNTTTIKPSKVRVHTEAYEFAHGKKPRGDGAWAFFPKGDNRMDAAIWTHGSYGQAKRDAQRIAGIRGIEDLIVGS